MEESPIELPRWLPWATTACLAALLACVGELWMIERERSALLREQGQLSEASMKATENQLEAERIINARQLRDLRSLADPQEPLQMVFLSPVNPARRAQPAGGVVVLDPEGGRGQIQLYGAFGEADDRDYQLWIDGPGPGYPARCGVFHVAEADQAPAPARVTSVLSPGCRLYLIEGVKGGSASLAEARSGGPIILASPPVSGKISNR